MALEKSNLTNGSGSEERSLTHAARPTELIPPAKRTFISLDRAKEIKREGLKSTAKDAHSFMPLQDQVVILPCEPDEMIGMIIVPETSQERQGEGIIVAVGPGSIDATGRFMPTMVEAGDRVIYGLWSGVEREVGGMMLKVMREIDLLGVIR